MNWRKFAYKARENGIGTLYTAMTNRDPIQVEGYKFKHIVNNEVQLDFISSHLIDILSFLRKELNNYSIELEIVEEEHEGGGKPFTSEDKYLDMKKRNPHLESLRKTFKLDVDL